MPTTLCISSRRERPRSKSSLSTSSRMRAVETRRMPEAKIFSSTARAISKASSGSMSASLTRASAMRTLSQGWISSCRPRISQSVRSPVSKSKLSTAIDRRDHFFGRGHRAAIVGRALTERIGLGQFSDHGLVGWQIGRALQEQVGTSFVATDDIRAVRHR